MADAEWDHLWSRTIPLRHGRNVADLYRLARMAAASRFSPEADHDDCVEAAWHALVVHLHTSHTPPSTQELLHQAGQAIDDLTTEDQPVDPHVLAGYWTDPGEDSPEDRVLDRLALAQVLAAVGERHRKVMAAKATWGTYRAAAAALGIQKDVFSVRLSQARNASRRLWFDGETPPRDTYPRRHHDVLRHWHAVAQRPHIPRRRP